MATVGQALTAPEAGWKRIDDLDSNILCVGTWTHAIATGSSYYKSSRSFTVTSGDYLVFKFTGSKIRLIGARGLIQGIFEVYIDGISYGQVNQYSDAVTGNDLVFYVLDFEKLNLTQGEHLVKFINISGKSTLLDAIDIIEDGYLISPLTAPMNLSASAGSGQVHLTWDVVDGATGYNVKRSTTPNGPYITIANNVRGNTYTDTTAENGTTYYYVVSEVIVDYKNITHESTNSNEASATPVAPSEALLRITMNDSSEREYQLTSTKINNFIGWFNQHTTTDNTSFMFNKTVGSQSSKEYLAFDKIISFEVIPVA